MCAEQLHLHLRRGLATVFYFTRDLNFGNSVIFCKVFMQFIRCGKDPFYSILPNANIINYITKYCHIKKARRKFFPDSIIEMNKNVFLFNIS